jgi:hypothetical protein
MRNDVMGNEAIQKISWRVKVKIPAIEKNQMFDNPFQRQTTMMRQKQKQCPRTPLEH